jgi:AP-2 complex subunit alpha
MPPKVMPSTRKFLFKNSEIIFENDLVQIGIKAETTKSIMQIEFYYGNKTNFNLTNLTTSIGSSSELETG